MKKRLTLLTALVLALTGALNAQGQRQGVGQAIGQGLGDNEKLTAYKIAFFTQRLDLTPAEAEKFWPLYNDFSARKSKMQADRLSLMRYAAQNEANMSNEELSSTADKLVKSFSDEATLLVTFNNDLKKVLPPAKIIRLYQVENMYKQQLLRELNQRRQGQTPGTGVRGRPGQVQNPDL